jgi:phage tail sheath protein FI
MAVYTAPGVYGRDVDLSQIVRSQSTSIGAVVGNSRRGPVNKRILFTNTRDVVSLLGTPDVRYGYGVHSLIAALEEMQRCYFVRVNTGGTYAGILANKNGATPIYRNIPQGIASESYEEFPFQITETVATADGATGTFVYTFLHTPVLQLVALRRDATIIPVTVNQAGDISGTGITAGTLNKETGALSVTFAAMPADGVVIGADYRYSDVTNAALLIFAENPGAWGNSVRVQIKEVGWDPTAFEIVVFETVGGVDLRRESFICSRTRRLDGHGTQMFVEDRINSRSAYIRVVNNPTLADNILPAFWPTAHSMTGGADGNPVTDGDISLGWQQFKNPAEVEMNVLINAGYVSTDTFAVQTTLQSLAETRRDCFAILDMPMDQTRMFPTTDARDWRLQTQNINSSFTALYSPWILVYDTYNDIRNLPLPPSGYVAQVFARTDWTRESWYAPAGFNRGVMRSQTLPPMDVTDRYGVPGVEGLIGDIEALYESPSGVNPILFSPGDGVVVFGQKTQQQMPSALDRINVRRLIITTERAAKQFLKYSLFEMNNKYTRRNVFSALDQYWRTVQARNGVYLYQVVCDESNNTPDVIDNNQLNVDVYMQPQKAAEFIQLQSIITRSGVDFRVLITTGGVF